MKNILNLLTTVLKKISYWGLKNILKFVCFETIYNIKFNSKTLFGIRNKELDYKLKDGEEFIEYIPAPYFLLSKSSKKINLNMRDINFVDFGSGAGRVMEYFLDKNIKFAKGVELSKKLVQITELNLSKFDNFCLFNIDAKDYEVEQNDNLFFFYDPFGVETMQHVVNNIVNSIDLYPRHVNIIYVSPRYSELFKLKFDIVFEEVNQHNLGIIIFSN